MTEMAALAEVQLVEVLGNLDDAIGVLRRLVPGDETSDHVCQQALEACRDARNHLEDVVFSLADGLVPELEVAP
jgi:hypothetical protein